MEFTVSRTFDAIDGGGFVYEDVTMDFRDVVNELRDMSWPSDWPMHATKNRGRYMWASSDYRTGETRSESIFVSHVNGHEIRPLQLYRLYRAAGLVHGRPSDPIRPAR